MKLEDKVVWISGASSGIGASLAQQLSAQGALLILSAPEFERENLERVAALCARDRTHILYLDLSRIEDLKPVVREAEQIHGRIDILVNNAGVSQRAELSETEIPVIRRLMDINFVGPAALTRLVLDGMIQRQTGQIVGTTSIAGKTGAPLRTIYSAAKHALHGFYDSLGAEVWKHGIRVTMVVPGFVRTEISRHALKGDGGANQKMSANQARGMDPARCARVMVRAIQRQRREVYTAMGFKGRFVCVLKALFPGLLARILRNADVR